MKLEFANLTDLTYLGKRIWDKKDGNPVTYYVSVDSDTGFGSFSCDADLFNSLNLEKYTPVNIALEYNSFDRDRPLRIIGVVPVNK